MPPARTPARIPAAKPRRRQTAAPARRETLTRETIADAALALIDRDGLEGLSMRKLGEALGVEAMALYHHHPNKGRLLDAVMDRLVDEMDRPDAANATPLQRLRRYLTDYRNIALRHPRAFVLLATRRFNSDRAYAMYERILQAFAELGLPPADAARWFRLFGGFASGAGLADVASRELTPDATPLQLERAPASVALPHVRAVAPHLRVEQLDAVFEFGLDVLFEALASRLPTGRRPGAPVRG